MSGTPLPSGGRTAVVRGVDGTVLFAASAGDEAALEAQLLGYVTSRCDDVLWPADARRVMRFADEGCRREAIDAYFASVGQRWDEEWLETTSASRQHETFRIRLAR